MNSAATFSPDVTRLGIHRIETPTPFPQVPTANAWLIEGPNLTLIDSGSAFRPAWEAFKTQLAALGHRVEDIRRIFVTHGHPDHAGLARAIVKRSGAQVYIHEADLPKVTAVPEDRARNLWNRYRAYYQMLGMPQEFIEFMQQVLFGAVRTGESLEEVEILRDGDVFDLGDRKLEVVACPGHTPGCACFHLADQGILFSGDHLLPRISPNPIMELGPNASEEEPWSGKFKSLISYRASLERTRKMDLETVLPGHGDPIQDHRKLTDELERFHQIRQYSVVKALRGGEATVYDLACQLFPDREHIELFLSISEMVGHLEVLEEEGKIAGVLEDRRIFYRACSDEVGIMTADSGA